MSGSIRVGTTWHKAALAKYAAQYPDELAAVEAAIPDSGHVSIITGGRPSPMGAVLIVGGVEVARTAPVHYSVGTAAQAVLRLAEVAA